MSILENVFLKKSRKTSRKNIFDVSTTFLIFIFFTQIYFFNNYFDWKRNGFAKVKRKWLSNFYKEKNKIIVKSNNEIVKGTFVNLYNDGSLKLLINNKAK